jgi:hypothetical protein
VIASIQGAGDPNPAWEPPPGSYDGVELCADESVASAIVGAPVTISPHEFESHWSIDLFAASRANLPSCNWTSSAPGFEQVRVTTYAGGAWMFPRMLAEPEEAGGSYLSTAIEVDISGADGTVTAEADRAWAAMSIGGSMIEISDDSTYDASTIIPLLERLAAHVGAGSG